MIKTTKDARTIRTGKDYTKFRYALYAFQSNRCANCDARCFITAPLISPVSFHVDHTNGRGMGGSKRDDTLDACKGLCGACHRRKHNQ